MFASLYAQEKTSRYLAGLTGLQDILGTLNDFVIARSLLDGLRDQAPLDALGLARGWIERDYAECMAELGKAWNRFEGTKEFWS
jgi:CHAD domain-containing protein